MEHIKVKCLGNNAYDITLPTQQRDAHLYLDEAEVWYLHIFNSKIKNKEKAYINTVQIGDKLDWNIIMDELEVFN